MHSSRDFKEFRAEYNYSQNQHKGHSTVGNQLSQLLSAWYPRRHTADWVLGTLYKTAGSTYRKAGAMMLLNSQGEQHGLLSGGCLENDIKRHADEVMHSVQPKILCYDGSKEDDIAFELGIGCGGVVHILLQPIIEDNRFLSLDKVHLALQQHQAGIYYQRIPESDHRIETRFTPKDSVNPNNQRATLVEEDDGRWLATPVLPVMHLFIAGAGLDARPLAALARELGWQVSLWDPRVKPAQQQNFPGSHAFVTGPVDKLQSFIEEQGIDAAVLMTHNTALDAVAISLLHQCPLHYLAMIGPRHRRTEVLEEAGLTEATLGMPLASPAGLDLGTTLPETIALSILAECQAVLNNTAARSLSGILPHD